MFLLSLLLLLPLINHILFFHILLSIKIIHLIKSLQKNLDKFLLLIAIQMRNSLPIHLIFQLQYIAISHADSSMLVDQLLVDNIVMLIGTNQ